MAASAGSFRVERGTRMSRIGLGAAIVILLGLAAAPWWAGRAELRLFVEVAYFLALAQMWNLLAGYAGLVSIGQQAYVGLGGYALFVLAGSLGVAPLLAIPLAGALATVVAVPTAFIVFRLRGAYFAIGTWVMAEVYRLVVAQFPAVGGGSGMSLPTFVVRSIADDRAMRETLVYWAALAIAVGAIAITYGLLRSRHGLALTAIRDSEAAAESLGVNNLRTKVSVYLITAFGTGMVGALVFLQKLRISPDAAFSVNDWTASVLFIVIIGGIGTIEGPIIGVLVLFLLRETLVDLGAWYMILLGAVAVATMLLAPKGIWGYVAERHDIQFFPLRRHLVAVDQAAARGPDS